MEPKKTLTVYNTSKSTTGDVLTDYFELLDSRRCGRLKVRCKTTNKEYWVEENDWYQVDRLFEEIIEPSIMEIDNSIIEKPVTEGTMKNVETYTVKRGDSLSSIAAQFKTTVDKLIFLNGTNVIAIGQTILV